MTQSAWSPQQPSSTNQPSSSMRRLLRKPMLLLATTTLMTGAIAIAATPFNTRIRSSKDDSKVPNNIPSATSQMNSSSGSSTSKRFSNDEAKANTESTAPPNSLPNSQLLEPSQLGTRMLGLRETTEDGERVRITAFEPDLDIYLHESTNDGIEVRTRSYLFGTSTDQIAVAATVEELREKYPEAFKLYKSYIDKAQPIPTSRYTLPAEEMPKLTGHGFLNSTLPISTMSLRESPATEKSSKTSTKAQKPTTEKSKVKTSLKKSDNNTGRTPTANKKGEELSRKSANKKTPSATISTSKKMPQKSAVSAKDSGKGKSTSSKATAKGANKAKSLTEANSKKVGDKSRRSANSQQDLKGKTVSGSGNAGKVTSKAGSRSLSNDGKAKPASSKNSPSKKIADKAPTKTKRSKEMKSSSAGNTDAAKDQAKSVSFEREAFEADQDKSMASENSGAINRRKNSQKSLEKQKQNEEGNNDSDQVIDGATEMDPETDTKIVAPEENESLDEERYPSQMDMEMNFPATTERPFGEEIPDAYWDTRHTPQVRHSVDLASLFKHRNLLM